MADRLLRRTAAALIGALTALIHIPAASAQTDFSGKTIRLLIGSGPGGGYDTYGRLVARHVGRHLPGNPTVVPQNMPGASSLPLTNALYNTAPRDGTTFAIINQSMPTEQYLHDSNINYDATKFNWIGRATSAVEMAIVWHTVPVNSIEDVRKREVIMGGTGPTSGLVFIPYLLNNLAGMKFKVITGFTGTTEIALAMERGEIEGSATPLESLTSFRADWVRDKKIKILVQYTAKRDAAIPHIPTMVELGRDEEARRILGFYASSAEFGRSFVAPPGMPAETVTTMRRAFDAALADPAFKDEVKRAGLPLNPMTGEQLQTVVADLAKFPPELIQKARAARLKPQ
jgi:tripartite-type tricarboxylate transporter receptor subunit TctC